MGGRKAISPLVAVVAIIGITLVISGVLTSYATRFTTGRLTQIQDCTGVSVTIQGARYDRSSEDLFLYVKNRGGIELTFDVTLIKEDGSMNQSSGAFTAQPGQLSTLQISGVKTDLSEVSIQSAECPGILDIMQKQWITGM